ncbi:MAG: zinc ribbon domain-containing protein [Gammaproteobacteria bacterium]|jgi:putative FmdB family regulatory protein
MPIYEYRCAECDHELEALQQISDPPLSECPECGRPALAKLVSAAAFRLKGGGWYETDFKTGNRRNVADGGGASSTAKSETPAGGAKKATA